MKLITDSRSLRTTFIQLLKTHKEYYFAAAWAGIPDEVFDELRTNKRRIKKFAVGIDFYHTHPEFLYEFRDKIVVTQYKEGTYHPKIFLFYNSDNDWTLITGSANFTKGAFYQNTEVVIETKSNDSNAEQLLRDCKKFIATCVDDGAILKDGEVDLYKLKWERVQGSRKKVLEIVTPKSKKYLSSTKFMMHNWRNYVKQFNNRRNEVKSRVEFLNTIRSFFLNKHSLKNMKMDELDILIGASYINRAFGSDIRGKASGKLYFDNRTISDALDRIPIVENVTKQNYDDFLRVFLTDNDVSKGWVTAASRLLAMKRPDTFFCSTRANSIGFEKHFNIKRNNIKLDTYWDTVVVPIQLSDWWNSDMPKSRYERNLWETRAAMLDVLYYEGF